MINSKLSKPKKKTTTQIICDNLGLAYQTIFHDYKCTLKCNFSYFGRLYIGEEHLMFVSNMFGFVKKTAIVIDTISKITQPTTETIVISGRDHKSLNEEQFHFSGLKNDNAYKIIRALWKKEKLSSEVLNSNDEEIDQSEKSSGNRSLDEASMEVNLFNPEKVETQKQKMLEIVLPCSVDQFYNFFLADDASVYSRKKHLQFKNATQVTASPWKQNAEMNADVREITAVLKVKGVPFKSEASMNQVWLLSKKTSQELNLKVITQMVEIPYSAYFHVEEQVTVTKETDAKCKFVCYTGVVFNKATYMKGTILSRTFEDLQADYKQWSENVKELLDKMKKQQQGEIKGERAKMSPSVNVEFEEEKIESEASIFGSKESIDKEYVVKEISLLSNKIDALTTLCKYLLALVAFSFILNVYQATNK